MGDAWGNNPYRSMQNNAMQYVIPIIMEKKRAEREDRLRKEKLAQEAAAAEQKRREDEQDLMRKANEAKIKYTQDMMKSAYEKGDVQGVQAFGRPLANIGMPVPAQEQAGPSLPGQGPPLRFFAAPQKQGMSEAELTQRALSGDSMARSILDSMGRRKKETAQAGAANVNVEVGEKSMTELCKEMSKSLVKEREDVQGAVKGLDNIKEAEKLLNSGMITGTGAEFLTNAGNLLASRFGFKAAEDPVANTQAFAATMGTQVGQIIKQFGSGTGLSDADREYAEKIVGGKITLNEEAIRKLFNINKKAYKNILKSYNKKADQAMSKKGAESLPYDLRIDYKLDDEPAEEKPRFKILKVE